VTLKNFILQNKTFLLAILLFINYNQVPKKGHEIGLGLTATIELLLLRHLQLSYTQKQLLFFQDINLIWINFVLINVWNICYN
jgi:hypothetical protein